jgi:hypothetical protein
MYIKICLFYDVREVKQASIVGQRHIKNICFRVKEYKHKGRDIVG